MTNMLTVLEGGVSVTAGISCEINLRYCGLKFEQIVSWDKVRFLRCRHEIL